MFLGEPGGLPQNSAIIKDDIDAHQLLEGGQTDTYPDDGANTELPVEDVTKAGAVVVRREGRFDLCKFCIGALPHESLQHDVGFVIFSRSNEETRAFRNR